jgi:hypothetical protein
MALFSDVIDFLAKVENPKEAKMNSRTRLTAPQVRKLKGKHPDVPEEFIAYLREVGAGAFRECQFTVYGFLGTPDEILGKGVLQRKDETIPVLCFGDNFSGDLSGFLPDESWAVVELWHDDGSLYRVEKSFGEYIREQMQMGPGGADLRSK